MTNLQEKSQNRLAYAVPRVHIISITIIIVEYSLSKTPDCKARIPLDDIFVM